MHVSTFAACFSFPIVLRARNRCWCPALVVAIVCWPLNTLSRLWNALGRRMPGSPEETSMDTLAGALKEEGDEASYGSTSRDASDASLVNPGWAFRVFLGGQSQLRSQQNDPDKAPTFPW